MEQEIWKDIERHPGYQVSSNGRVRSIDRYATNSIGVQYFYKGTLLTPIRERRGYLRVGFGWKKRSEYIHRLVAEAFIPNQNPIELTQVNHKNEDKTDNRVENLEWCTNRYNSNYGTRGSRIGSGLSVEVNQYDLCGNFIRSFKSLTLAAKAVGASATEISFACQGKMAKCRGYKWRYADRDNSERFAFNEKMRAERIKKGHEKTIQKVSIPVVQFSLDGKAIKWFASASVAGRLTQINHTNINKAIRGVIKTAGGYIWRYASDCSEIHARKLIDKENPRIEFLIEEQV